MLDLLQKAWRKNKWKDSKLLGNQVEHYLSICVLKNLNAILHSVSDAKYSPRYRVELN